MQGRYPGPTPGGVRKGQDGHRGRGLGRLGGAGTNAVVNAVVNAGCRGGARHPARGFRRAPRRGRECPTSATMREAWVGVAGRSLYCGGERPLLLAGCPSCIVASIVTRRARRMFSDLGPWPITPETVNISLASKLIPGIPACSQGMRSVAATRAAIAARRGQEM